MLNVGDAEGRPSALLAVTSAGLRLLLLLSSEPFHSRGVIYPVPGGCGESIQFLPEAPEAAKHMSTHSGYTREQMNNYRNGSVEAANLALPCEDAELRDAYLSIAKTWNGLADKIERELRAKEPRGQCSS